MKTLRITEHSVREITIDIDAAELREAGKGYDVVIVRITGLNSPSGRPVSRTIRLNSELLEEPGQKEVW